MTVTILAVAFIIVMVVIALFGFKAVIRQGKAPEDIYKEHCSLCREPFPKAQLIERQIGDYRLFYFCGSCITKLHDEMISKN